MADSVLKRSTAKTSSPFTTSQPRSLAKLEIPNHPQSEGPGPPSSSESSLFLSSSPFSPRYVLSSPTTPISAGLKPSSRNDIFSEVPRQSIPPPLTLSPCFNPECNIWDVNARKRRSGAYTRSSRTSRSSTPQFEETGLRVDFSQLLGRGLTSEVYVATLPSSEVVAAKIPFNEETSRILEREAAVLEKVHRSEGSTEYVIPYYGKYTFEDSFAICLDLCPQNMQDYVSARMGNATPVVTFEVWKSWLETLLSGVEFLHHAGILHNDIKPHNILLTSSLHPYLSDFAVATPLDPHLALPTAPGLHILGTTVYTAPELLSSETVPTSPQSDIYSLGITMFVAATGLEPFCWTRSVTQKIMLKKRGDIFAGMDVRVSDAIVEIIRGMCAVDPTHRWDYARIRHALAKL
jgi:Protein kinase domain